MKNRVKGGDKLSPFFDEKIIMKMTIMQKSLTDLRMN